jgi:SAM-dependent methyltransferase
MSNFDAIANVYDRLSQFVFGSSMQRAQTLFLDEIPPAARVLILGGGTGWLLAELLARNPTCQVWYIEASAKMLELTKAKVKQADNTVHFIQGTENSIPQDVLFDAVITHCYLDLFMEHTCRKVICKIRSSIHSRSLWLVSDFINTTWWQGAMLVVMYFFFRIVCNVQVRELPEWKKLIAEGGFVEVRSQEFFQQFIVSSLFRLRN